MSESEGLQKRGVWGVSEKKGFDWPPNTEIERSKDPKKDLRKWQKYDWDVMIVLKNRRFVKGKGCMEELKVDCSNLELREG